MNVEFNGPIDWFQKRRNLTARPSVIGVDDSVSGVALYDENYHTVSLSTVNVNTGLSVFGLLKDETALSVTPLAVNRRVKLHPSFTVDAQHTTGSAPSEWVIRLLRNGEHVASGWFRWNPSDVTTEYTFGTWETPFDPILLQPSASGEAADNWVALMDNDGSGTLVDTIGLRTHIGFTTFDPVFEGGSLLFERGASAGDTANIQRSDEPMGDFGWTFACWIKPSVVFTQDDGEWCIMSIAINGLNFLRLRIADNAGIVGLLETELDIAGSPRAIIRLDGFGALQPDVWYSVVVAYTDTDVFLCINGDWDNRVEASYASVSWFVSALSCLGADISSQSAASAGDGFQGNIYKPRFYDIIWGKEEVRAHFAGVDIRENLISAPEFDEIDDPHPDPIFDTWTEDLEGAAFITHQGNIRPSGLI